MFPGPPLTAHGLLDPKAHHAARPNFGRVWGAPGYFKGGSEILTLSIKISPKAL